MVKGHGRGVVGGGELEKGRDRQRGLTHDFRKYIKMKIHGNNNWQEKFPVIKYQYRCPVTKIV